MTRYVVEVRHAKAGELLLNPDYDEDYDDQPVIQAYNDHAFNVPVIIETIEVPS